MATVLAVILTTIVFAVSIKKLIGFKFNTQSITMIGIVAAMTILLNMIKLVPFPLQGFKKRLKN